MSESCAHCGDKDRTNQHRLKPITLSVHYESPEIITTLDLPRKYTTAHRDISIGHDYNKKLLECEDIVKSETHIIGQWIKNDSKYEIHLEVLVSTSKNLNAESRTRFFCDRIGLILEEIAFAETALLKLNPSLAGTKIFVHFKSLESKYNRVEYWHRLGYWTSDSMRDPSEVPSVKAHDESRKPTKKEHSFEDHRKPATPDSSNFSDISEIIERKRDKKTKKSHQDQQRLPPQMCTKCKR